MIEQVHTVLVDGNNVSRKHNQATKLRSGAFETQAIFGCIKSARALKVAYPGGAKHTWLWDGRAQWRYDIHPDYKSKRNLPDPRRDAERASHNAQKPFLTQALDNLGIGQMLCTAHEADDLAGLIIGNVKSKNPNAIMQAISGDGDWVQLVREGVGVRDLNDDAKIYTLDNLMDKTGYRTPYAYLEGKCLHGDGSDDIPGVGGIGEKGAPEFLAEFGSVRNFWHLVDTGAYKPKKKAHQRLASPEGRAAFGRNLRLMQLIKPIKPEASTIQFTPGKLDEAAFKELCEKFSFLSILRDFDAFVTPFRN